MGMTIACLWIGASIVAVAFALSPSVGDVASCDEGDMLCEARIQLLAFGIFGLPGVVLIAAGARIGARARDRQLAALRLLGVSGRSTAGIVMVETMTLTCLAALAALGTLAGLVLVGRVEALSLTPRAAFWTVTAVLVVATVSSALAARASAVDPAAVVRERPRRRPRARALVPVIVGVGLLSASGMAHQGGDAAGSSPMWVAGVLLAAVGLPLAVPVLLHLVGQALTGPRARPIPRLVGRSLQFDARASTRLIAILATMTFLAVIVQGLWADYVSGPLTAGALQAQTHGPNDVVVDLGSARATFPETTQADILDAVPLRVANCADGTCAGLLVATCTEYRWLVEDPDAWCDPDRAFTLGARPDVPARLEAVVWRTDAEPKAVPVSVEVETGEAPADLHPAGTQTRGDILTQQLSAVVPPSALGDPGAREWVVSLSPGLAQHAALQQETGATAVAGVSGGVEEYTTAIGFRTVTLSALLAAFIAGLSGLVLLGVDGALDRRRAAGRLARLGVPRRVVTGTYLIAHILPLAVGLPLAALIGALAYGVALYEPVSTLMPAPLHLALQTSLVAVVGANAASVVIGLTLASPGRRGDDRAD